MERHSITRQTINLRKVLGRGAWVLLALLLILGLAKAQPAYGQPAAPAATFTVNDMGDQADVTPDGNCAASNGKCTLRAAIMEANYVAGHDIINFNNSYLIMPGSVLPDLSDVDGVTITGAGYNVWINGTNINTMVGLNLVGDGNIIQGLVISHFYTGIQISNGSIENIIGTDGDGTGDETERNYIVMNNAVGILVASPSGGRVAGNYIGYYGGIAQPNQVGIQVTRSGNIIGTNGDGNGDAAEGNVISGNTYEGLQIITIDATQNVVAGNIIGLDPTGSTAVPNGDVGINIRSAPENLIGTDGNGVSDDLERNIISGNVYSGIYINQENAANNVVAGNWIGLNASGDAAVPNGEHGVYISTYGTAGDMNDNIIGTNGDGNGDAAEGNIISGNVGYGIYISGATISQTVIAGNWIGLNAAGDAALPNGQSGIYIGEAPAVRIGTNGDGTSDALEGNVISGNTSTGILIGGDSSTGNKISGNVIGLNAQASAAVPNGDAGVSIATSGNVIGTDGDENGDAAERNIISGNAIMGIAILGGAGGNVVAGNWIGLDIAGTTAISNTMQGIYITQADNRIGTDGDGKSDELERNIVSGNGDDGIYINYSGASGNVVAGNWVGLDATGNAALPNGGRGVFIGAGSNTIGTNGDGNGDAAEGNVISGNGNTGLYIQGSNTSGVIVAGNLIGLNAAGTAAIANASNGLSISDATETRIGTNGDGVSDDLERNTISGNGDAGVYINCAGSHVSGNTIGLNADGNAALSNGSYGLYIRGSGNTIGTNGDGNGDAAEGNVIAGNGGDGISLSGSEAISNVIAGNLIGLNAAGTAAIANANNGINTYEAMETRIGTNGDGVSDDLERNIISGNTQNGISLSTRTSNSLVAGNIIGLNAAGDAAIPNGMWGVDISAADHNTIGTNGDGNGDTSESNLISGNGQGGIAILNDEAIGNLVTGNNIYANNGLGIDLRRNGVTPNDPGDTDIGANNQQNFPVLEAAVFQDGELTITGTLETSPTQQFTLELFASEACDASGYGEGQYYLGAITATTDISGSVDFVAGLAMADRPARFITATATDPEGNTSEFSACAGLQPFISVADTVVTEGDDGQVSAIFTVVLDYTSTLTVTVDYATADGTALAGVDYLSATGQLTFLAGEMTQTITVTVLGDTEIEADENFTIILSAPENAILANTQALGTIMDDDVDVIYVNYLPLIVR